MVEYKLTSINIGKQETLEFNGKQVESAINKQPVEGRVFFSATQVEGDVQVNLVHHGGADKAVCLYSYAHYPYWEQFLEKKLSHGAFGENVTVDSLTEQDVCIGDIFQLGEAVLQVSQPRMPCAKLGMKHHSKELQKEVEDTGFSGFYCRVLQEGNVTKNDYFVLKQPHPSGISVAAVNAALFKEKDEEAINQIVAVKELAESWRKPLLKMLGK